jgi:hypothetical protein
MLIPSILAHNLATFQFMGKNLTQEKLEQAAAKAEEEGKAVSAQFQIDMEKSKIHTAAQSGNVAEVKKLLESAINVICSPVFEGGIR